MLRRPHAATCVEGQCSYAESGRREMNKLDDETKAELLTFLVVGQLFAFTRSGE